MTNYSYGWTSNLFLVLFIRLGSFPKAFLTCVLDQGHRQFRITFQFFDMALKIDFEILNTNKGITHLERAPNISKN